MAGSISTLEAAQTLQKDLSVVEESTKSYLRESGKAVTLLTGFGKQEGREAFFKRIGVMAEELALSEDKTNYDTLGTKEKINSLQNRVKELKSELPSLDKDTSNKVAIILKDVNRRIKLLLPYRERMSIAKKKGDDRDFQRLTSWLKDAHKQRTERRTE